MIKECWNCRAVMDDQAQICPECGKPQFNQYGQPFPPSAPRDGAALKRWIIIISGIIVGIVIVAKTSAAKTKQPKRTQSAAVTEHAAEPAVTTAAARQITDCFDIIDTQTYTQYGRTVFVRKLKGKENACICFSGVAKDKDGNVIGKAEDTVALTAGKENYFIFGFDQELPEGYHLDIFANQSSDWAAGPRDAVELVASNQTDRGLYLTFRQTADTLGVFSRYKLLFYKGSSIIYAADGTFTVYAKNLESKGDEDVAEVRISKQIYDYDRFEYFFEP